MCFALQSEGERVEEIRKERVQGEAEMLLTLCKQEQLCLFIFVSYTWLAVGFVLKNSLISV